MTVDSVDVVVPSHPSDLRRDVCLIGCLTEQATLDHFEGDKRKVASALKISLKTFYARLSGYKARTD